MAENQKDPQAQGNKQGQGQPKQGQHQGNQNRDTDQSKSTGMESDDQDPEMDNDEGTKMPGRESRTPTAGSKTGDTDSHGSGHSGKQGNDRGNSGKS